ncbi:hypothetical protein [Allisonella histaminiformans]|nr:hypothetical protein [Allisonella histaminiformans]
MVTRQGMECLYGPEKNDI